MPKYADDEKLNGLKKDGSKIKVLIVDDSLAFRRLLKKILEEANYEVVGEVADGKQLQTAYAETKPDVVTLDITMPELDGIDALEVLKRNHPDANVVMVTSLGQRDMVEAALQKGIKGYILKPITEKQIPKILETIKKAAGEL